MIAIDTNPRVFKQPTPPERALAQLRVWLEPPAVTSLAEGEGNWAIFEDL